MSKLYEPFVGKNITARDINILKSKTELFIQKSFEKNYKNGEINYGKNLLIVKVANIFVNNFLNKEIEFVNKEDKNSNQVFIKDLEEKFTSNIWVPVDNINIEIKLEGVFDRVDKVGDILRIIDYKTGRVESRDLKLKEWEDLLDNSKLDKCFQLLFYSYVFKKATGTDGSVMKPGIISFRNLNAGFLNVALPDNEPFSNKTIENFENVLKTIFLEIFNPEIPFCKTEITDNCKYCSFKSVCNR